MASGIIPNAWVAREVIGNILKGLEGQEFTCEQLGRLSSLILSELRIWLGDERDTRAEQVFRKAVTNGVIHFRLRADGNNWTMPMESNTAQPEGARQLLGNDGGPLKKGLFTPAYAPSRITVIETKGDHLAGNEDTNYKARVLELMTEAFA